MPITPGKCPQVDGVPNCPPYSEKDCIEVFKIYDQCAGEELLGRCVLASEFCSDPIPADAVITCNVVPNSARCFHIGFGEYNPPFYRPVMIQSQLDVEITVSDAAGNTICGPFTTRIDGISQFQMWAPPGTLVQCQIIAVGDCACDLTTDPVTGDQLICCRVYVCKEIQIKALVRLLVPSYGFCELDPCTPVTLPYACPGDEPLYPPQRCQEPPVVILQETDDSPIPNVNVSIIRAGTTTTVLTDANGTATFTTLGAIVAGDIVQFVDPTTQALLSFTVPTTFTDTEGTLHDSNTVCTLQFTRVEGSTFNVFIDGIQNGVLTP